MPSDVSALLSPSPRDLALLFEASRLLSRYADLAEALFPLIQLLEGEASLERGTAAFARVEGAPLRIVSGGSLVTLGEGLLGAALEKGRSLELPGLGIAAPVLVGRSTAAILGFTLHPGAEVSERARALGLVEGTALLLAEAISLRRRLASGLCDEGGPIRDFLSAAAEPNSSILSAIIGRSPAMAEAASLIERIGPTESTVLISGESGTGKELAARALHAASRRAKGPFVAVNCASLPEPLIESELFGHERGAFTGAHALRKGRFEMAAGGSLFFDEVAELGLGMQAKLLRVLQERSFERVGGSTSVVADVRVISATNRDLSAEVAAGRFREDLYWRIDVLSLRMPPLRERGADLILLADHFAEKQGRKAGKPILRISTPALDLITSYHWPGNVRELENAIERAVVLSTDGVIHAYHLPPSLQSAQSTGTGPTSTLDASVARLERELIVEALKTARGNSAEAARALGITERRIGLAMRRYGVDWRRFRTSM